MNSTSFKNNDLRWYDYLMGYFPFVIIFLGVAGNSFAFFVLRSCKELKNQSSMIVFSFIAILDLFSLFTWNLNSYFRIFYNFSYEMESLIYCRLMAFLQFFSLESSALLLSFISIDRFFTIISKPGSCVSKLPFGTPRTAVMWSLSITSFAFLFNTHYLILNGYPDQPVYFNETIRITEINGSFLNKTHSTLRNSNNIQCYSYQSSFGYIIKTSIYSVFPFVIMTTFNSLIIYKTAAIGRNPNRSDARAISSFKKRRQITISLVSITFLFLVATLLNAIFFEFLVGKDQLIDKYVGIATNHLVFLHHSTLFFSLYVTNIYFRKAIHNLLIRNKTNQN